MRSDDLRALLDPLAAIQAARPVVRTVETPSGTEQPVAAVLPAQLPQIATVELAEGGTGIDLAAQVALLQSAVARLSDLQLRGVHGQRTFTSTLIWAAGDTRDVAITWTSTPLAPCRYAVVRMDVGIAWLGKLVASVVQDSVTDTGCTVRISATAAVVITAGSPLTVHADGSYFYWPPFEETT